MKNTSAAPQVQVCVLIGTNSKVFTDSIRSWPVKLTLHLCPSTPPPTFLLFSDELKALRKKNVKPHK